MNLHEYLLKNLQRTEPYSIGAHSICARRHEDGKLSFYIHPSTVSGDTIDFEVLPNGQLKELVTLHYDDSNPHQPS
jgi:hypothetical protein